MSNAENEYPTFAYAKERIGRDVRVVYPHGGEVWGILQGIVSNETGDHLLIEQMPQGSAPIQWVQLDAVAKLYVRG